MLAILQSQQDHLLKLEVALAKKDYLLICHLLVVCEKLDLHQHDLLIQGYESIKQLQRKRNIIKQLIDYIRHDHDHDDTYEENLQREYDLAKKNPAFTYFINDSRISLPISILLNTAKDKDLDIDQSFLIQIEEIYHTIVPKNKLIQSLRKAIEYVCYHKIVSFISIIQQIQLKEKTSFGELEINCGKEIIHLFDLELQIHQITFISSYHQQEELEVISKDGILTKDIIHLCDELSKESIRKNKVLYLQYRNNLKQMTKTSLHYERVIRCYKWIRCYCPWRYHMNYIFDKLWLHEREQEKNDEIFYSMNLSKLTTSSYLQKIYCHHEYDISQHENDYKKQLTLSQLFASIIIPPSITYVLEVYDEIISTQKVLTRRLFGHQKNWNDMIYNDTSNVNIENDDAEDDSPKKDLQSTEKKSYRKLPKMNVKKIIPSSDPKASKESQLEASRFVFY